MIKKFSLFFIIGAMIILGEILKAQEEDLTPQKEPPPQILQQEELKKAPSSVLEIKKLSGSKNLFSIELREAELADIFRVIAHDFNLNILVDKNVKGKVTASFTNISLEEAIEKIAEMNNLRLEKKGNVIIVKPNLITKVFRLKYISAKDIVGEEEKEEEIEASQAENITQEENVSQTEETH